MTIAAPLLFLLAASTQAPSAPPASACPPFGQPEIGARFVPPPAGVPLLLGVETGMTEAQVRQIDRRLVRMQPVGSFELVPGLRLRATVNFYGRAPGAVSVEMSGGGRVSRAVAALRVRFGPPARREGGVRFIDVPGHQRGNDFVRLRWCDGPRMLTLTGQDHNIGISISATGAAE